MVQDAQGNLFGTTILGGNTHNAGTIYELQKAGKNWLFHSLYSFCSQTNCTDGNSPEGGLIVDTSGDLYGTTGIGGDANHGVVYELRKNGKLKVLYSFCAQAQCADGASPVGGLTYQGQQTGQIYDGTPTLYGTTEIGGPADWGLVYTIAPGTSESVLYALGADNNPYDGQEPLDPLIMDSEGNLYGTTNLGGSTNAGTIFTINPSGMETMSFAFCSQGGQDCGGEPGYGALLMTPNGALVGTTRAGGYYADGVIYSFAGGHYTTLAAFCNASHPCRSGGGAECALIEDSSGNLYGVAPLGGKSGPEPGAVFEFSGLKLKPIYTFCARANCTDGQHPYSKLIMNSRGHLFGTTIDGGAYNAGTIFELL
jgi:uncharacterized repeat protein (TIGR03803 family)